MNRFVVDPARARERASASPDPPAPRPRRAPRPRPDEPAAGQASTLRECQLWFARAMTTPEAEPPAATDAEVARVLTAGPRLGAVERLEIYRRAYHARLIECLVDDYPVLSHALGDAAFTELCREYIARHPSDGPSLNCFGRRVAEFCRQEADAVLFSSLVPRGFAADLADLEWAIVEVIHAASAEPLTIDGLRDVVPEAWPEARLVPNSALRLLRFEHPVNEYFQAFRDGGDPAIPAARWSATVVYRSGPIVWRMDLTTPMFDVLSSLSGGETLAASLARAESGLGQVDEEEAGRRVMGWFREWVASGLFARVVVEGADANR